MAKGFMIDELRALEKLQNEFQAQVESLAASISDKVEFEFTIFYQPGDGFVIEDDKMGDSPLDGCLEIIGEKGVLTHEDFESIGI